MTIRVPQVMRAAAIDRFGGPEVLTIHSLPVPRPDPDEVLIAVHTAGVGSWDADTAIGQLAAHAPIVADYASRKTLVKVLVVPDLPNQRLCSVLKDRLDIRLLTFTRSAQGHITFDGLKEL